MEIMVPFKSALLRSVLSLRSLCTLGMASALACAAPAEEPVAASGQSVIGGVDAASERLDAVGALLIETPEGKNAFCTGTLIAPTVVLTAKHCAMQLAIDSGDGLPHLFTEFGTVTFAVGHDSGAPRREVIAASVERAELDFGGVGFGADVAAYILAEPIADVAPLPVARASVTASDAGKSFVAIGYGVRDRQRSAGLRTLGNITLSAIEGSARALAWGSVEAYLDAMAAAVGGPLTPDEEQQLRLNYDTPLLEGYEAFFASNDGDVQVCSGDSGGPLLRKVDGKLSVFGVASWVPSKVDRAPCSRGSVYAIFGPSARTMVDDVLRLSDCGDVSVAGRCDGDIAVRCISLAEGTPRITRTHCADVDQTCKIVDGRAACAD